MQTGGLSFSETLKMTTIQQTSQTWPPVCCFDQFQVSS